MVTKIEHTVHAISRCFQGHSRSLTLVQIGSPHATSY